MSNKRDKDGNTRPKKYQKQAMKVTATGRSTSTTEAHLNRVVHALPPKPVQPGRSGSMQPLQTQQRKSTQAVSTQQTPSNPSPRAHPKPIGPTRPQEQRKPAQVVRRQQRTPSAFLRLPADILAQIVPHLDPLEVVHLARVNTSVRKILMHRSASPMWRACIGNTGLPACPPELSEPRYISVLYVSLCSSCGNREERKPDTYLFVRLCMPCRKKLLVDWSTIEPTKVRDLVLASDRSCTKNESYTDLKHSLKLEVEAVNVRLHELQSSGDENSLQNWTKTRKEELERRKIHAKLVTSFMDTAQQRKKDELKRSWCEQVERKLLELGCTQKVEDLPCDKQARWRSFFNRAEVLTDSKWTSLERQILSFVEAEAKERPERERKQRHASRNSALRTLFNSIRYTTNTLPDDLSGVTSTQVVPMLAKWLPPPEYSDIYGFPVIQDLLDTDVTVEDMTAQFEERRGEIMQSLTDWGTRVKQGWVSILREGREKDGLVSDPPRPRLLTSGAGKDPFEDLDPDTSLLLRADSIFNFAGGYFSGVRSYDTVVLGSRPGSRHGAFDYGKFDLYKYTWDSEASAIARKLLLVVGHPDASTVEFNADPAQFFACERCHVSNRSWIALVVHYVEEAHKWKTVQARLPDLAKLGIVYNYIHDLESDNPRPLAKRISAEEEAATAKPPQATQASDADNMDDLESTSMPNVGGTGLAVGAADGDDAKGENKEQGSRDEQAEQEDSGSETEEYDAETVESDADMEEDEPFPDCFVCKVCERGQIKSPFFSELPAIFPHLVDVHEISDPQARISGEGSQSVKDSPHIRLIPSYQAFGGWGISFLSGPVEGSGH